MSFRLRLTLFFVLIVVLPIVALAILVSQVASDSESGKVDARLSAGLRTATTVYEQEQANSKRLAAGVARELAADPATVAAMRDGDRAALKQLARAQVGGKVVAIELTAADVKPVRAGEKPLVADASVELTADGEAVGSVDASGISSTDLLDQIREATGEQAALAGPRGPLGGTMPIEVGALPASGDADTFDVGSGDLQIAATEPLGDERARVALFAPAAGAGFLSSRPKIAVALVIFLLLAILAVGLLVRALQGQIKEMLQAARRIGAGDFTGKVPVTGSDEMAGLASEFNKMSDQLADQMDQLRRQRVEIDKSVRRVGEAFAAGLDRQALLAILVETAVGTCQAHYGLVALSGHVRSEAEAGEPTDGLRQVALAAESQALREHGPVEVEQSDSYAFASSLGRIGQAGNPVGAMTIARRERPFNSNEREVFLYLAGQAAASVENVALHELVSEQAVTDDLTGLANNRAFRELMDREAARAKRFGHDLSLMILDLDDFKRINDLHGHPQGDAVLRAVGRILTEESRGIDAPARYGGEEFVVALPETDSTGAAELAERVRVRIAAERVPLLDQPGTVSVTTSVGVATMPGHAADADELISQADSALYEAKRAGKDRIAVAKVPAPERRN